MPSQEIVQTEENILVFDNIFSRGYGFSPQVLTRIPQLSIEAKGLYSYFSSFAGQGGVAFPSTSTILAEMNISKTVSTSTALSLRHGDSLPSISRTPGTADERCTTCRWSQSRQTRCMSSSTRQPRQGCTRSTTFRTRLMQTARLWITCQPSKIVENPILWTNAVIHKPQVTSHVLKMRIWLTHVLKMKTTHVLKMRTCLI